MDKTNFNRPLQHQFLFVRNKRDNSFIKLFRWLLALKISNDARVTFGILFDESRGMKVIQISYNKLATFVNDHPSRIRRAVEELISIGLISRETRKLDNGVFEAPIYTISDIVFQEITYWSNHDFNPQQGYVTGARGLSPVKPTVCHGQNTGVSPVKRGSVTGEIHGMSPVQPTVCHGRHPYKKKTLKKTVEPSQQARNILEFLKNNHGVLTPNTFRICQIEARSTSASDWDWLEQHAEKRWKLLIAEIKTSAPLSYPKVVKVAELPPNAAEVQTSSAIASLPPKRHRRIATPLKGNP